MSVCWTVLLVLSFCQPGTVQTVQDQTGGKRDHFFYWNPLSVYFPLAVYYVKTDRKISDDQIALENYESDNDIEEEIYLKDRANYLSKIINELKEERLI